MIADFGVSQFGKYSGESESHAFVGSAYWMAPEQLADGKTSSKETDMWSFGLTLYEVVPFTSILLLRCSNLDAHLPLSS